MLSRSCCIDTLIPTCLLHLLAAPDSSPIWCSEVEQAFASGQAGRQLVKLLDRYQARTAQLGKEAQGSLPALQRSCACALVTAGLYNCQTLDSLIRLGPGPAAQSAVVGRLGHAGSLVRPVGWAPAEATCCA